MRTFTRTPDAGPGDYIPYPAGTSIATLTGLFFVGRQPVTFQGESRIRPTVVLAWEGADRATDGRALSVLETLTDSLNEKSTFFNRILALTGGQEPPPGLALRSLLGQPAVITVRQVPSPAGRTYARVVSCGPLPRGLSAAPPSVAPLYFDLHAPADSCPLSALPKRCQRLLETAVDLPEGLLTPAPVETDPPPRISDLEVQRLQRRLQQLGLPLHRTLAWMERAWGLHGFPELSPAQYQELWTRLDQWHQQLQDAPPLHHAA